MRNELSSCKCPLTMRIGRRVWRGQPPRTLPSRFRPAYEGTHRVSGCRPRSFWRIQRPASEIVVLEKQLERPRSSTLLTAILSRRPACGLGARRWRRTSQMQPGCLSGRLLCCSGGAAVARERRPVRCGTTRTTKKTQMAVYLPLMLQCPANCTAGDVQSGVVVVCGRHQMKQRQSQKSEAMVVRRETVGRPRREEEEDVCVASPKPGSKSLVLVPLLSCS